MNNKISKYICISISGLLILSATLASAQNRMAGIGAEPLQNVKNRVETETQKIQQLRTEAETKISQIRDNVKNAISKIKDEQKQRAATQISEQITHLNTVWTDHFTLVLNDLDLALQKIQTRADKAKANGKDTSSVNVSIQAAKNSIQVARSAIATQAAKTYAIDTTKTTTGTTTPTVSTAKDQEQVIKNIRKQFMQLRDQLQKDITTLRDGVVKDARNSVKNALKILSQIPGVDNEPSNNNINTSGQ